MTILAAKLSLVKWRHFLFLSLFYVLSLSLIEELSSRSLTNTASKALIKWSHSRLRGSGRPDASDCRRDDASLTSKHRKIRRNVVDRENEAKRKSEKEDEKAKTVREIAEEDRAGSEVNESPRKKR